MFNRMLQLAGERGLEINSKSELSRKLVNITKNAIKHADSSDEQHVWIDSEEAIFWLLRAVLNYQMGSREPFSDLMNQFEAWLRENRPEYIDAASHTDPI